MTRSTRIVLAAAALIAGLFLIGTFAAAAAIYREGSISISVEERGRDGQRLHLRLPAALARAALVFVPDSKWQQARIQTRAWGPAMKALSAGLSASPDGTFVHIEDRDERISIAKTRDTLVIDVDSKVESVRVSVPLRTMVALVHRLAPGQV